MNTMDSQLSTKDKYLQSLGATFNPFLFLFKNLLLKNIPNDDLKRKLPKLDQRQKRKGKKITPKHIDMSMVIDARPRKQNSVSTNP